MIVQQPSEGVLGNSGEFLGEYIAYREESVGNHC